jgi:hypothetical protein
VIGFVLVIPTAVLAITAALSHFIRAIEDERNSTMKAMAEPEEVTLRYPNPYQAGWHNCTVRPITKTYEEEKCFVGSPTMTSTYEYEVKGDQVFERLLDEHIDGYRDGYGDGYFVVNGQVLEADIRKMMWSEAAEKRIKRLKRDILWHELTGSVRYFIMSKHRCRKSFFSAERGRLQEGFAALEKAASGLGATRKRGRYEPPADADEQTNTAVENLQQDVWVDGTTGQVSLMSFRICFSLRYLLMEVHLSHEHSRTSLRD